MRGRSATSTAVAILLFALGLPVLAQAPAPFDMTPERGNEQPPTAPPTAEPPPQQPATPAPTETPPAPPAPASATRFLIPFDALELNGEEARQGVSLYLTPAQAASPAKLDLGYLNALVVSPEASQLRVDINGTTVLSSPIASSASTQDLSEVIPAGVLKPGANIVEFLATQRHRTDCSVASTYELWSRLDPARTAIRFDDPNAVRLTQVGELAATGVDADGRTTVHLLAPGLQDSPEARQAGLVLAQNLGKALHVPDLRIEIADTLPAATPPGHLNIVMAPAAQLPPDAAALAGQGTGQPVASFEQGASANTLVLTGPDWKSVEAAAAEIGKADPDADPTVLPRRADLAYPILRLDNARRIVLGDVGVRTAEFNGRRYTTGFEFALPPDFYSNMFGQATLMLNAAYSSDVLPESQFNIYVNGQIASSTPVLRLGRGFSRDTPINIPMTNFRPGRNKVELEVLLQTEADKACPPGLTQMAPTRFVISANTRLQMPDFARIGAFPDLSAFAGTGAPYADEGSAQVYVGEGGPTLASAMTVVARAAVASGALMPLTMSASPTPDRDAIIVAPLAALPADLVRRSGVAGTVGSGGVGDDSLLDSFRQSSGNSANPFDGIKAWLADRLGLRPQNFWLVRADDGAFVPQSRDGVILSQVRQPEGGVWTYLTIPDETHFLDATRRLAETVNWRAISGRVSALGADDPAVVSITPNRVTLVQTQPPSLTNYRLIAANWLSSNILEFTLLLGAIAVLLTLATWGLLKTVGRKS